MVKVKKRDGRIVDFDAEKIEKAIYKAMSEVGKINNEKLEEVVEKIKSQMGNDINEIDVERIQDNIHKNPIYWICYRA